MCEQHVTKLKYQYLTGDPMEASCRSAVYSHKTRSNIKQRYGIRHQASNIKQRHGTALKTWTWRLPTMVTGKQFLDKDTWAT